jgi:hypothetical protein
LLQSKYKDAVAADLQPQIAIGLLASYSKILVCTSVGTTHPKSSINNQYCWKLGYAQTGDKIAKYLVTTLSCFPSSCNHWSC